MTEAEVVGYRSKRRSKAPGVIDLKRRQELAFHLCNVELLRSIVRLLLRRWRCEELCKGSRWRALAGADSAKAEASTSHSAVAIGGGISEHVFKERAPCVGII